MYTVYTDMNTKNNNHSELNEKIAMFRAMIEEAREDGLHKIADLYAGQLQSVIAMARFDGKKPPVRAGS